MLRVLFLSAISLGCWGLSASVYAAPCDMSAGEAEVLQRTNKIRQRAGLSTLRCNSILRQYARKWSRKMCQDRFFSHDDPEGRETFSARMSHIGLLTAQKGLESYASAENIFAGSPRPQSAMRSWMNSPGHRQNILTPQMTHLGVGYIACRGRHLWTQIFMRLRKKRAPSGSFGMRVPQDKLSPEQAGALLLVKPGTRQRSVQRRVIRSTENGQAVTTTITTTRIISVYPGPRPGSRKIVTRVIVVTQKESAHGSQTQQQERTNTQIIYNF
ncbi:MAG: hypothetical protein H6727_07930 [Myxococcales bacterium]|nr:hypothetical protein [Myxococcales bacterium]